MAWLDLRTGPCGQALRVDFSLEHFYPAVDTAAVDLEIEEVALHRGSLSFDDSLLPPRRTHFLHIAFVIGRKMSAYWLKGPFDHFGLMFARELDLIRVGFEGGLILRTQKECRGEDHEQKARKFHLGHRFYSQV